MLEGLTKKELIEALDGYDDDAIIIMGVNYGDRLNTIQAIPATSVDTVAIKSSGHSETGFKISHDFCEDQDDYICINYQCVDCYLEVE